ncbi:MAG TPA: ABC transporter substrate-binding protein [Xanthobacteraceae bacterium]|nr:ABC transporter substrate-binding protein [Xanthobacteraceae bacterium]
MIIGLANDAEMRRRINAFEQALENRGWTAGRNLEIVYRFADNDADRLRRFAQEFVAASPDCILAHSTGACAELKKLTRTIPIVFVSVADPIGSGFVASMARPGGNMTGFTLQAPSITSKYLSILKELVPRLTQVASLYNADAAPGGGASFLPSFDRAAAEFNVTALNFQVNDVDDIARAIGRIATEPASGLIVMPDNFTTYYRATIIALADKYRVPTIYPFRYFVEEGGLLALGVDGADLFRRAADYVDRVLRGTHPSDLPVQAPTKLEFAINLKTAKAQSLRISRVLLAGADVVIE